MALVTNSYEPQNVQRPMSNVQCPTSRLVIGHSTLDICLHYGEGGIRTPDRGISPYNGLANRRLQPLGHLSSVRHSFVLHGPGRAVTVVWVQPWVHNACGRVRVPRPCKLARARKRCQPCTFPLSPVSFPRGGFRP